MRQIRKLTRCIVPKHGTKCEVAHEQDGRLPRTTEKRIAMRYEEAANVGSNHSN